MSLQLIPFLMMDGNAREAIRFYEQSLDAAVLFMQTVGDGPENPDSPVPEEQKDRVAHSVLKIGETEIFMSDLIPGQSHQSGNQVNICITTDDTGKAKRFYESLLQDGQVNIQLQETHFSPAYGMVTDKFGVTFQIFAKRQH